MLRRTARIAAALASGLFEGDGQATTRVTVEPGWWLNTTTGPIGSFPAAKLPIRWWQSALGNGTEVEIPNIKSVAIDRSLTQDADTLELDFFNTATPANGSAGPMSDTFGERGYLAPFYGSTTEAQQRWNQTPNAWKNMLRENSLLRVYQGYGGWQNADGSVKSLATALSDGSVMLTGVFLVDTVAIEAQTGVGKLVGRSMAKLLIDQSAWPPLVPSPFYTSAGIVYYHNQFLIDYDVPGYGADGSAPVPNESVYGGAVAWTSLGVTAPLEGTFVKAVYDLAVMPDGDGYRLVGSDGGVFCYGSAGFAGSEGNVKLAAKAVSIDNTPSGNGYWVAGADGGVFNFGDAAFYGSLAGTTLAKPIVAIRRTPTGRGYWMCGADGGIFAYGDAQLYGNATATGATIKAFTPRPQGDGYWLLSSTGHVYAYGNAGYNGGLDTTTPNPLSDGGVAEMIDSSSDGLGYRIVTSSGGIFDYGTAQYHTLTAGTISNPSASSLTQIKLAAPISAVRRTPDDHGFFCAGMDGGVFTFGDASFHGSLPGDWEYSVAGNYTDYTDIISDFLLWSGFYLKDAATSPGKRPPVYGLLEATGAYNSVGPIPPDTFDKVQIVDIIKKLRDVVGAYIFRVREDGSVQFTAANIWQPGNFYDDGTPTPDIPVFDETHIIDYIQTTTDQTLRSEILVAPVDPYIFGGTPNLVTVTRLVPPGIQTLRGLVKPAMIGVPLTVPISQEDQDLMAELQALYSWLGSRTGQLSGVVDPAICPDDQIRIFERSSGETNIHYVIGVRTEHDLVSGQWTATYSTQWMGGRSNWAISSNFDSFFGANAGTGTLTDQTFDGSGNLIYSDTFKISDTLGAALGDTGSSRTSRFRVANNFVDIQGFPSI